MRQRFRKTNKIGEIRELTKYGLTNDLAEDDFFQVAFSSKTMFKNIQYDYLFHEDAIYRILKIAY